MLGFVPIFKFLMARFYHKAQYLEHTFGPEAYGYSIAGWKVEIKKDQIKNIFAKPGYLIIKLNKGTLYLVAEPSVISQAKEQLLASDYKNLVVEK